MIDYCDTEEGKEAIERLADSIREEIEKDVLREIFDLIKKADEDAFDRGRRVL